ncbi:MAG: DNA-binding transcriptional regulator [Paludibacterium sp.]|uniref:XylR family transcriptional regulator n=1 Tax=Paludibacterium sp. TaxID=1917523 RepID=UPI0025F30C71|nr:DNA-binding transcriptional regulator [Paludibacterium sp.]MBV8049128.1 DNA-binding transcriptional regulator [Paludibacterium sp.]MBV8646965.1 DNA-binding transcriptional regulator [Paludibacterium sp.]
MSETQSSYRVALLFNANKIYDREIITGIGDYLRSTRTGWDLFLEEDYRCRLNGIERWQGHGIIADFDDPEVSAALARSQLPVVAVGGSYADESDYPDKVPYVATDNFKLVKLALDHLIESGLQRFACFSLPAAPTNRWAQEREKAFEFRMRQEGLECHIYRGEKTYAPSWETTVRQQMEWLQSLPKPIGIVAVTDARALQLLQACLSADIAVPEQVALIGIDNDPLARTLTRIPLSSVAQGTHEMGMTAAHLMHRMLHGVQLDPTRIVIPPAGINVMASSRHEPANHPYVMKARHFIRLHACHGIRTEQVADYVGVSRSSLEMYFRRSRGHSVHDEILHFKLAAAQQLLRDENLSIAEIAIRCGFSSMQYMHAVFKRELGCTPRGYQEQLALSSDEPAHPLNETGQ